MPTDSLDELDFGILHLLQQDARHTTPIDMAERLPVTDTTIRNRIQKLEDRGIIEGYVPLLNYGESGFQLRVKFTCTAPPQERSRIATPQDHAAVHSVPFQSRFVSNHNSDKNAL